MDREAVRMVEDIPPQLKAQGWRFNRRDSHPYPRSKPKWYIAVYEQPFEDGVDDDRISQPTSEGNLRVNISAAYHVFVTVMNDLRRRPRNSDDGYVRSG